MIRRFTGIAALPAFAVAAPALAHTGHVAEQAGHSHYVGIAAVAAVSVIAGVMVARGVVARRRKAALNG